MYVVILVYVVYIAEKPFKHNDFKYTTSIHIPTIPTLPHLPTIPTIPH